MTGLRGAATFLTRLPVGGGSGDDLARSVPWFPIVGLGVGAVAGLVYWAGAVFLGETAAAVLAVGCAVAVTGAFHEDGLADTFDGLSSIRTPKRQLEIMQDSRLGTFGVAALTLVLLGRVLLVAELPPGGETVVVLAWVHGASRALVTLIMTAARAARPEGTGAAYLNGVSRAAVLATSSAVFVGGWWVFDTRLPLVLLAAGAPAGLMWLWSRRRIGGVTGDVLGACQQLALVAALAAV